MNISKLNKQFVLQHGQSDCGPACLASLIKYYEGNPSLDNIRRITGTTKTGTKMLGLYQGAKALGFDVEGMEAENIENLKELTNPAILHVIIDNKLQHYVVFYGFSNDQLIIGDPGQGVSLWPKEKLQEVWQSHSLLSITPNENFIRDTESSQKKYARLLSWIKEDFNILIATFFLGVLIAIFSLATAIFYQKLIDVILPTNKTVKLLVGLTLFGLILLGKAGLGYVRSTFLITQSMDFNNRMIGHFFKSLLYLPKPFFDSKKIGEMIARMNDTQRIQLAVNNLAGNMLIEGLVITVSLVGVFIYSWQIGIIVSLFLPIYLFIIMYFNKPVVSAQNEVMGKYALNEGNYIDVINGIQEIKATGTAGFFHRSTTLFYNAFQKSIFDLGKIQVRFNFQTEFVGIVLIMSVVAVSSYFVITGQLMLGVMMAILSLSGSIGPSLKRLALFNIQLQEAKVAFNRMEEFTSLEEEASDGEPIHEIHSLEIDQLSFNFPGALPLLKDISLKISKGKITTLLGESGAGKSSILQLLQRFYQPTTGQIMANGKNINSLELNSYRKQIGLVPQEIKIFNNYLLFNIALTEDPKELELVPQWCRENGFDNFFSKFPQGYGTLLGEEGANISGGQKQMVGLARALYRNPDILLIDEGTSAMDKKTEQSILSLIQNLKNDKAILMVTHRMKVATQSDIVYALEDGKVSLQKTLELAAENNE